ncbi:DUF72 domain-containing protein [Achromobacter denitrificans]|uniref:DUF72 domain-containing protein n=1 Tax=Achromobacter denitrificans TaxID=32002 RepID=A0ABZ3G9W1_ACHDE|nr:DUF72 domain-containing protein [Achromobacter denitrificans]MDX3880266.1 DUF72 domain-containing protein [Achromobacter sp.]MBV2161567.1 DUF72 domain-containing protein [Achromobacter denitrificans]MDF3857633.1 DUF72 domain-containing protein [Achromobacter denitrificans]MDF3939508.1 DUF72 domain-containing protein [Achromobacter denitrificans]WFC66178.1 DUF72 domain-containing protein [Achromobacter denitrificans]
MRHTKPSPEGGPAIRVGIGGWTYAPWRGAFYPEGLPHARELEYASSQLTAIEINGTYYSSQKPATFAKWRDETPDGFVFSLKASRYATNRRELAGAKDSVDRFVQGGIAELGPKLGPIVWQFAPTKVFDPEDFGAFLALLPDRVDGLPLRHVLDVRHPSFACEEYLKLARRHHAATVFTDSEDYPSMADCTAGFVYARLMRASPRYKAGYAPKALDDWASRLRDWARGKEPADLPRIGAPAAAERPREVYAFFINGAKERAPDAARALIERL